jgi:hypothetical protein
VSSKLILTDHDFNGVSRIINLPDGTAAQHPATVAQLQAAVEGLNWKDNVRVATSSNINLASPGATLDGVTMAANDRFVAIGQTNAFDNGIYIWNGAATPATRALDANSATELLSAVVIVDEGTSAGAGYRQTAVAITLGTTNLVWTSFGAAVPTATTSTQGKIQLATQTEVNTGTDANKAVTPATLAGRTNEKKLFSADIGDGSATSYTVTHSFNTKDIHVVVRRNSGNFDVVDTEVRINNVNSVDVLFSQAPSSNQFRVIILG